MVSWHGNIAVHKTPISQKTPGGLQFQPQFLSNMPFLRELNMPVERIWILMARLIQVIVCQTFIAQVECFNSLLKKLNKFKGRKTSEFSFSSVIWLMDHALYRRNIIFSAYSLTI